MVCINVCSASLFLQTWQLISRNNYNGFKPFLLQSAHLLLVIMCMDIYGKHCIFLSVTLFMCTLVFWFCPYFEKDGLYRQMSILSFSSAAVAHPRYNYFPTLHNQSFKPFFLRLWDSIEQHSNVAEYFAVADLCCKQTFVCCITTVNPIFPIVLLKNAPNLTYIGISHIPCYGKC